MWYVYIYIYIYMQVLYRNFLHNFSLQLHAECIPWEKNLLFMPLQYIIIYFIFLSNDWAIIDLSLKPQHTLYLSLRPLFQLNSWFPLLWLSNAICRQIYGAVTGQNVDKPKRRQPKRQQPKTSTNRNVDRPKRWQTKTSTDQNDDKPKRRQTETSTNQNVDRPKRRQTEYINGGMHCIY